MRLGVRSLTTFLGIWIWGAFAGFAPSALCGQEEIIFRPGTDLGEARAQLRGGQYETALASLGRLARSADASAVVLKTYALGLAEVGRYGEAFGVLGEGAAAVTPELENTLGEVYLTVGRLSEAEVAFRRAMESGARDRHVARLNLGVLLWESGDREEALALFDSFIDLYNGSRERLSAEELMSVGVAVRYLGVTNSQLYQDALMAFDDAAQVDPDDPRPDLLAGELFLEKYRATDARESLKPVLEQNPRHPRALLNQAKILDFEGVGGAAALVRQALEVNPHYSDAHAFLGSLHLATEDFAMARAEAELALEVTPTHLEALSVLASSHFLSGQLTDYEEVRERVHALNPSYSELYATVAHHAVAQRQYQTAVDFAQFAVGLDPTSWRAYGVLGMNQMRTGKVEEGRRNLEIAFEGDPYNPWYKNTLDLLDTFERFESLRTDNFEIFLHEREAELLGPYAAAIAEEAFASMEARYGTRPPTPIRLEVYPNHADFSVRTLGLTGLGALGVSFGSTLVMDSPSALDPGNFNWASTLWHEVAHAFHLAMSDHRVPRWFTEGLAVHEQHKARTRWGHKASPAWLQAYQGGRLHPVSQLNQGFIRPQYPQQVVFSYYQASLVFDLVESEWGLGAILDMLDGYRAGKANDVVFREVLGQTPEEFDTSFDSFVQNRWGSQMAAVSAGAGSEPSGVLESGARGLEVLRVRAAENPGSFPARMAYGHALFREERFQEAEAEFQVARELFPEYGAMDSPLRFLAEIHRERGELERAARAFQQLGYLSETLHPIHEQEAGIWIEVGEAGAAARALEKVVELVPFEVGAHEELAGLYGELGEAEGAVRERRAILALDPTDRAEAHYKLALALAQAGEGAEARSQVLRALEIAPSYEAALDLLLELRGGGGGGIPGGPLNDMSEGRNP